MSSSIREETDGMVIQHHRSSVNNYANTGAGHQHNGAGDINRFNIKGDAHFVHATKATCYSSDAGNDDQSCLRDLRTTDPREDKKRIEDSKGGLLRDSYNWILEHSDYRKWCNNKDERVLWIKGDPGKGKTMLLCGIIDEMSSSTGPESKGASAVLSFFFCQATDSRINNATAVLRGLIYLLIDQKRSLLPHVRKKYDDAGKALFEDANAWFALRGILEGILQDPDLGTTYLIVDALDECTADLSKLLDLINHTSAIAPAIKWVISSRNWTNIEESLRENRQRMTICLELNPESVSDAVHVYIKNKTNRLAFKKNYDHRTREAVAQHLMLNAKDTFLWVALVCQNLESVTRRKVLQKLKEFPPGLDPLYQQMVKQINDSEDSELCKQILAITLTVYRPINLAEISSLLEKPSDMPDDLESLEEVIALCGSLLTLRQTNIYFVHQSAKDFLLTKVFDDIFPSGVAHVHYNLFWRSLQVMVKILRRDLYSLKHPGVLIDQVKQPKPDPLAVARYSCVHWGDHLMDSDVKDNHINDLKDDGLLFSFLGTNYLYWLEALSLMKSVTDGIAMIIKLQIWVVANKSPALHAFIHDGRRFAVYNRFLIEKAPLQSYCSALLFVPQTSIVRTTFANSMPNWIHTKPIMSHQWSESLQTLEGHSGYVSTVAFSPDGKSVVSGSGDMTVRLWDAATGAPLQTLEGHSDSVSSVAFSPDGKSVVSGSYDSTLRLWDAATGAPLHTLKGHCDTVSTVDFSPDCKSVVSGSGDSTVRLWDAATGAALQRLEGHYGYVSSVAFSPDGKSIASGSWDSTVRLWDTAKGAHLQTIVGHSGYVSSVAFAPDGKSVVSGSHDSTVRLWDTAKGAHLQTIVGHSGYVSSVAFAPDGKSVVSGSSDTRVRLWDAATGAALQTLEGHSDSVRSVAFSPDGNSVVSGSLDSTLRLWDAAMGATVEMLEGHSDTVSSVAFSPDGKSVVSGSWDNTVRLWDSSTGAMLQTLEGHFDSVSSVAFSPNGKMVVSGSEDSTLRLWDAATGAPVQTLEGHYGNVSTVAFSRDGKSVVSGSDDGTVRLWDTVTGAPLQMLEGHADRVNVVAAFPHDFDAHSTTIIAQNDWIVLKGKKILWLPPEYRSSIVTSHNSFVCLGLSSGRVIIIGSEYGLL